MPVPKRKRSRARRDSRHANKFIRVKAFSACSNCDAAILPHQVCKECGTYKGEQIMTPKSERAGKRLEVRSARQQSQAARMKAQEAAQAEDKA